MTQNQLRKRQFVKFIAYTERVTSRDIHGNVLKDISASQGNTTTASPNTAETNTPWSSCIT